MGRNDPPPSAPKQRLTHTGGLARIAILMATIAAIAACTPANLKQRDGYWADQARSARAYNQRVRFVVLHYTDGDEPRALKVLTGNAVSSHYLVGDQPPERGGDPVIYQLVDEYERAWHAGTSAWAGRSHLNDSSVGVEIVNAGPVGSAAGPTWHPFKADQIAAVVALVRDLIARYDIKPVNVVGHSDIAPGRKVDPGPLFPWQRLYRDGIGAWPDAATVERYRQRFFHDMPNIAAIQSALARYGYSLPVTGELDQRTHSVLVSFQMHFRPARYDGVPDIDTAARLWALNAKYR
jgi:N-acetylmuramoyl-L-alanine amidase